MTSLSQNWTINTSSWWCFRWLQHHRAMYEKKQRWLDAVSSLWKAWKIFKFGRFYYSWSELFNCGVVKQIITTQLDEPITTIIVASWDIVQHNCRIYYRDEINQRIEATARCVRHFREWHEWTYRQDKISMYTQRSLSPVKPGRVFSTTYRYSTLKVGSVHGVSSCL